MMASIKGMQLLKLPESVKENAPPSASSNSAILKAPSAKPFQLLSAQVKPPNDMSPKLIIIPGVSKTTPHSIPLLKLPQNTISTSSQHPKREQGFHASMYHFPLLKKPAVKEQISLIEIQVRDDRALEIPQLIQVPVKQGNDIISTGSKHLKEHHTKWNLPYNTIQSRRREPSNIEIDASQNMGRMPGSKPLKRKRRRKRPVASVNKNVSLSTSKKLETFASGKESCVSQSTQTTTDELKRTKNRRKKMNLMALLEEAALFDASSASSGEEDMALKMLKNKSFLVKGDPYKESNGSRDGQSLGRGITQTSLEELLLRNFDEGPGNVEATPPRYPLKDKKDSIMWEKRRKKESSTQTISEVDIPKCLVTDKPKSSAGLSWKEMIALSQGTSTSEPSQSSAASLKEIGVQVSESVPAIDKIEQTSQTDFTNDNDVVSTLLENLKKQGAFKEEHLTDGKKNGRQLGLAQQERYPWQYIADTDFSDVALAQEKSTKPVKSQGSDLVERKWQEGSMSRGLDYHKTASPTNSKNAKYDSSIIVQSRPVHAPPEIFLGMKVKDECIELSSIDGAEASRPMNIVEISRPSSPIMMVSEVVENVMIRDIPLEMLQESFDVGKEIDINKANVQKENAETRSDGHQIPENLVVKDTISEERKHMVLKSKFTDDKAFKDKTSEVSAQASKLNSILAGGPKDRMHSNLRNMSVQLDALDELYEHLQKELKNSAMLMQTVDTLHHGFLEEPRPLRRVSALERDKISSGIRHSMENLPADAVQSGKEKIGSIRVEAELTEDAPSVGLDTKESIASGHEDGEMQMGNEDDFDYQSKNSQADSCNESAQLVVSANQSKDSLGIQSQVSLGNNIDNKEEGIEEDDARERIINKHPTMSRKRREEDAKEKEMELKLRIEKKRQSLRDWMKKKRIERNEKYLMEVEEKRQKESRPFAGKAKNTDPVRPGDKTLAKEEKIMKKEVKEIIYQERIDGAQQLLDEILAVRSNALNIEKASVPHEATVKRQNRTVRYPGNDRPRTAKHKLSPTHRGATSRPKRSTVIPKALPGKTAKRKGSIGEGTAILDKISPSWKYSDIVRDEQFLKEMGIDLGALATSNENESFLDPNGFELNPYSSTARSDSKSYKLEFGSLTDRPASASHTSRSKGRRSVEGKEFVTQKSMEMYRRKTAELVRESLKKYGDYDENGKMYNASTDSDNLNESEKLVLEGILNDNGNLEEVDCGMKKRQRIKSPVGADEDVEGILRQYGLLDNELEGADMLETKLILAEADAVLDNMEEGREIGGSAESIDWNEINNILKKN